MWTTSTAATDRAGNPLVAGVVTEAGTAEPDFQPAARDPTRTPVG